MILLPPQMRKGVTDSDAWDNSSTDDEGTSYTMVLVVGWTAIRRKRNVGSITDGPTFTEVLSHIQRAVTPLWIWRHIKGVKKDPSAHRISVWVEGPKYVRSVRNWRDAVRGLSQQYPLWGLYWERNFHPTPEDVEGFVSLPSFSKV